MSESRPLLEELAEQFGRGLPSGSSERRSSTRQACIAPAVVVPTDPEGVPDEPARRDGIVVDVSETGLRLVSRTLQEATHVEVRIPRPSGGSFVLGGEVVRQRVVGGYRELGVRVLRRQMD